MNEIVFRDPPRTGKGSPGVARPGVTQSPTQRQPNRGRKPGDPFVCVGCRETFPADQEYKLGGKLQGRCLTCGPAKRNADHARRMAELRGPDYVLPVSKDAQYPIAGDARECSECGESQLLVEFYKDTSVTSGYQNVCKSCRKSQRGERWHSLSPEEKQSLMDHQWRQWIWRTYNFSPARYDAMLESQNGLCALCRGESDTRLCVDHDHNCCSGRTSCGDCVRELLCIGCNVGLGQFEDRGVTGAMMDKYLSRHGKTPPGIALPAAVVSSPQPDATFYTFNFPDAPPLTWGGIQVEH